MQRFGLAGLLLAAAFFVPPATAFAQTPDDCFQAGLQDDDQKVIDVCTRVLDKGGLQGRILSTTLSNRGLGYLRSKQYDKAIIDFSEAILVNPKNPFAFDNRGDAWREKGNYDRALSDYNEALSIEPTFTSSLLNRGITHELLGDKVKARADYEAALNQKGTRPIDDWARRNAKSRLEKLGS
ncbi:MAG: tetratricopeptide repeat protein [Xanthobacteraceae bacterium]|nr:tetratricopeptide repeat protein [Xanthobacteraceae bacterium]MBX3535937.1 tetratricopeptide repeat protein [Xanthobacteraceae bacterium]MBX3548849.1 tetratricopeptide repeat protein [Xanthobacteraceae bacterium]MCW5674480.1 tetratricopeptide repeat protein [Xanthobacteraceae bacterium]MCW5678797.1 tetratricopeptide repeat protein [Xanthobacteraceae bacterium]